MKRMKKVMCLLLAFMLVLGMSMTAFAAEDGDPEGNDTETVEEKHTEEVKVNQNGKQTPDITDHTYVAYQIFKGTQAANDTTDGKLASIEWGKDFDGATLLVALKNDTTFNSAFATAETAADVAKAMQGDNWEDNGSYARAFAKHVNDLVKAGKAGDAISLNTKGDSSTELDAGYYLIVDESELSSDDYDAHNMSLLQLTQKGPFEIKNKIDLPTVEKKVEEKNDSTGVEPVWQDAADYDIDDDVPFQLTGTLPANYDDYEKYKYVFHDTLSAGLDFDAASVTVTINGIDVSAWFDVTFDVKPVKDSDDEESDSTTVTEITITCGDLNSIEAEDLTITSSSEIVVTYTATLTEKAKKGTAGNLNEVYLEYSNNPNGEGTGSTPKDIVIVFTYDIVVNKVDENNDELPGAGFTLYKWNAGDNENGGKWEKVGEEITGVGVTTFEFKGVDSGWYKLEESTTPAGYNTASDIYFKVVADYDKKADTPQLKSLTYTITDEKGDPLGDSASVDSDEIVLPTFTVTMEDGTIATDVVNKSGITLPETGGIGTTIFYVVGGILVVGCGVILVTRKRVRK